MSLRQPFLEALESRIHAANHNEVGSPAFSRGGAEQSLASPRGERDPKLLWRIALNGLDLPFDLKSKVKEQMQAERGMSDGASGGTESVLALQEPGAFSPMSDMMHLLHMLYSSRLNILLLAIPLGIVSGIYGWSPMIVFASNFLALLPLALILGQLTEDLIWRFGETTGGLLNATFGNVVEMILGLAALSQGLMDVVAASLIGSILSNLLLVMGCCFLFGGLKHKDQSFNAAGNKAANSLLFLACISIVTPTMASVIYGPNVMTPDALKLLSHAIALLLVVLYGCYLLFQLKTHATAFNSEGEIQNLPQFSDEEEAFAMDTEQSGPVLSLAGAITGLAGVAVLVAICSEYLTGALEAVSESTKINKAFLGLIVLPIAGNAAEHFTAVFFAIKNRMDAAIAISVGSSIQIAVFVLPVTVLVGWAIGKELTLAFDPFAVIILTLSVVLSYFVTSDGYSNWLLGLQVRSIEFIVYLKIRIFNQETDIVHIVNIYYASFAAGLNVCSHR